MAQFEPLAPELKRQDIALAYIAAEKREGMFKPVEFLQKNPVSFPFLLDEDRSVTKAYGVYHRLSHDAFNIARPATFVISPHAIIRWIRVGESQTDRAPIESIQQQLASIR